MLIEIEMCYSIANKLKEIVITTYICEKCNEFNHAFITYEYVNQDN